MISVIKLSEILKDNYEAITLLLNEIGVDNIKENKTKGEIRFSREYGWNPTSSVLDVNSLRYYCFSHVNFFGNIYTLVMDKKNLQFKECLEWIAKVLKLDIDNSFNTTKIRLPFKGFFKQLSKYQTEPPELTLPKYDNSILEPYNNKFNTMFFKDGINYQTQQYFNIGYDVISNRITIPEYDISGNLVGIMGRLNDCNCNYGERWLPLISCKRGYLLYGFHLNYKYIQEQNIVFIGESEKFVMQLHSMGIHTGLALGTNHISKVQEQYLKELRSKRIILCFDEGVKEEDIRDEISKLKSNNLLYTNSVGYIYDKDNDILTADSKDSPTDLGKEKFAELLKNHLIWL